MASEQVSIFTATVINKIITLPNKSAQDLRKPILIIRLNWLIVVDEMVWKQYARTFCFALTYGKFIPRCLELTSDERQ